MKLELTQKALADRLGIAESTLCRWERGGQIPQRHSDLILRAFFDVPAFRDYLEQRLAAQQEYVPVAHRNGDRG